MDDITLERPHEGDGAELYASMRGADYREVLASAGPSVQATINKAIAMSPSVYTVRDLTGHMLCIFGTVPLDLLGTAASPWMLGTQRLEFHKRSLVTVTKAYFRDMLRDYPLLVNYVDARHEASLRLLRALGCTIDEPVPHGFAGLPFHRFWKERGDV